MDYDKEFEKFGITADEYPLYDNAEMFSRTFKKCTKERDIDISYSNHTVLMDQNEEQENYICQTGQKY